MTVNTILIPICLHSLLSLSPQLSSFMLILRSWREIWSRQWAPIQLVYEFLANVPEADTIQDKGGVGNGQGMVYLLSPPDMALKRASAQGQVSQDPQQVLRSRLRHEVGHRLRWRHVHSRRGLNPHDIFQGQAWPKEFHGDHTRYIRVKRPKDQIHILILPLSSWVIQRKSLNLSESLLFHLYLLFFLSCSKGYFKK